MISSSNFNGKRALITGGAGFIGSNLVTKLLNEGWEVTIIDNLCRKGSEKNLVWLLESYRTPRLNVVIKDIRDYQTLKDEILKVNVVFHLAAQVAVTTSFINPREDFEINALGSFNVLEAARESGHKPIIVFASTNKVYGQMNEEKVVEDKTRYVYADHKNGISESFPLDFHSPYGCSNGVADQYTRDYYRIYQIPTVVFRQSCIYGPRQMGVEDQGWVAHFAIASLLGKNINIYGDGKQVRDLLHVNDLINAYLTAVNNIDTSKGQVYNIGGGIGNSLSLLEYITLLEKLTEQKVKYTFSDWRPGDQKVYISNNTKLKKELNWEPSISTDEGLKDLTDWVKQNTHLFDYFRQHS